MQKSEAISTVAAELGVFSWEADENGCYGAVLANGLKVRLVTRSDGKLLLEGQLLQEVSKVITTKDSCMEILKWNFSRSIVDQSILTYVPEWDEIAVVRIISPAECNEDFIGDTVEKFLAELDRDRSAIQAVVQPSDKMPFNPYRAN
jgi:hypothetical protein